MNVPSRDPELLLDAFKKKLAQKAGEATAPAIAPERWSYRDAAAVLHCFKPGELNPLEAWMTVENPHLLLVQDIVPASGGRSEFLQTLKPDVRRESLRRLGTKERMLLALGCNPQRVKTELQQWFEAILSGTMTELEQQTNNQLRLTLQVAEWLDGILAIMPPMQEIQNAMSRRSVLASFEHLVVNNFIGREDELLELSNYVGVRPPSTFEVFGRFVRKLVNKEVRPPLVITGPGGIGKSALVGRFLYEHLTFAPDRPFPFAYLPFDNPVLKVEDPFTLLLEAAGQFELEFPESKTAVQEFRDFVKVYRDTRGQIADKTIVFESFKDRLETVDSTNRGLAKSFGKLLRDLVALQRPYDRLAPVLLVLDTFEEVEYRSAEQLTGLWRMLGIVQGEHPGLKVVISGRRVREVSVNNRTALQLQLPPLSLDSSVELLIKLGVEDPDTAYAVAEQIGGNPLTLRLAARVLKSEGATESGISGLKTRTWYLTAVSEEIIRGQLYRRVLDHIHDEDVKRLAHPGMVLRRVTPKIIAEVLAPVCGVDVSAPGRPQEIFDELRKEHALVLLEEDGSLHYRPEIRIPMLNLITQDMPQQARAIHEAAINYYQGEENVVDRTEEIYHRMMLDQDSWILDGRWMEAAGLGLAHSLDEFPVRAISWLGSKMSLNISKEVSDRAQTEEWERHAARRVRDSIRYLDWPGALKILRERTDRSNGSLLYALEARAYLLAGDYYSAAQVLDRGIASLPPNPNRGRSVEMLWIRAEVAAQQSKFGESDGYLEEAQRTALLIADPLCRIQILSERLHLRRRKGLDLSDAQPIEAQLAEALSMLDESQADSQRGLVRNAIALLGSRYPVTFRKLLQWVEMGNVGAEDVSKVFASLAGQVDGIPSEIGPTLVMTVVQAIDDTQMNAHLVDAIAKLILPPGGTGSAPLVGIDEYREKWELENPPESV